MPNRSYSFKEGLAMMAAKDVGIDPYLAAEAGEDARSILAALRRAKTAKGPEKSKHIAAAQTELRKLNPKQHGKLINALQAKVLALQGRGGDTAVAHLEPGELVVPRRVLTPELMQLIAAEAAKRGIDPKQLIVGSRKASINPATGTEEFGVSANEDLDLSDVRPISVTRYPRFSDDFAKNGKETAAMMTAFDLARKWEDHDQPRFHEGPEGKITNQYGVVVQNPGNLKHGDYSDPAKAKQEYFNRYAQVRKQMGEAGFDRLNAAQVGSVMDAAMNVGAHRLKTDPLTGNPTNAYTALVAGDDAGWAREVSEFRMYKPKDSEKPIYSAGIENRRGDGLDVYFGRERLRTPNDKQIYEIPGGSPRKDYEYKKIPQR